MEMTISGGARRIRQLPGPWNALGPIKFILPNIYGVYLHGTKADLAVGGLLSSGRESNFEASRVMNYVYFTATAMIGMIALVGIEIKNSILLSGTNVGHLSYVGDSVLGEKVNFGAGTVTVNYDGVNKFRTEIGDGAFIGSGSMLIAPVKIGANANTGAGSTITKDAPEGKLTLARARQVTIEGWKRPQKPAK